MNAPKHRGGWAEVQVFRFNRLAIAGHTVAPDAFLDGLCCINVGYLYLMVQRQAPENGMLGQVHESAIASLGIHVMKNGAGKRVLVADDDMALLRSITDYLVFEGYEVVVAHNGKEALARMDERVPDILVLDINMPGMGGLLVLKRLQRPDGSLPCPTLILTARSAMQAFFGGVPVDGFLAKPCSQDQLVAAIQRILSAKDHEAPPARCARRRLLVCDNTPERARQLQAVCARAGYDVVVVTTGSEVLERARAELPDAILMSEVLPNMNGSAVAAIVRAMPSTRSIPIVLHDEFRTKNDELRAAWKVPEGVVKLVGPTDPLILLKSVQSVLGP